VAIDGESTPEAQFGAAAPARSTPVSNHQGGRDYIFGYGSLVSANSRRESCPFLSDEVVPVRVNGMRRKWAYPQACRSMTCVGVEADATPGSVTNGVLVPLPSPETLKTFDHRERHYVRRRVALEDIEVFHSHLHQFDAKDRVWVYMLQNESSKEGSPKLPSKSLPIAQSYVDVCLSGFLDFGVEFAREFVKESSHWQSLEDDRSAPKIYSKGYVPQGTLSVIDSLLASSLPHLFKEKRERSLPIPPRPRSHSSLFLSSGSPLQMARGFSSQPETLSRGPVDFNIVTMATPTTSRPKWHRHYSSSRTAARPAMERALVRKALRVGTKVLKRL